MKTGAVILICFGFTAMAFSQTKGGDRLTAQAIVQKSRDAYAALTSYRDTGISTVVKNGQTNVTTFSLRMQRTNLFLLQWVQVRADETNQGRWWSAENGPSLRFSGGLVTNILGQATNDQPIYGASPFNVRMRSDEATVIMEQFFRSEPVSPFWFESATASMANSNLDRSIVTDGKVGDVACYVLTSTSPELKHPPFPFPQAKSELRTWIGKQDFLVHRYEYRSEPPSEESLTQIHENIVVNQKYPDEDFQVKIPEEEQTSSITLTSPPPATNSDLSQTNDPGLEHRKRRRRR